MALSEAAKEINFVYQILSSMGLKVKAPIVVRVDNVGAIFKAENMSTGQRTRHVDIFDTSLCENLLRKNF